MSTFLILAISAFLSLVAVGWIRQAALNHQLVDIPNERSSHRIPTPRGGGLGIVVIVLTGALLLALANQLSPRVALAILAGGPIAVVGFLDDRGGLSPLIRAAVHFVSAIVGLVLIGGMVPLDLGATAVQWGWLGHLVGIVGIVWMTNLYNFMDGIDGLAGSEAVFVFGVGGLLLLSAGSTGLGLLCVLFAGANIGFLRWNWPPAKIFMGDIGSSFLGYSIAIVSIASAQSGFTLTVWLILVAVFAVDATVTLVRRMAHGERWYQPHRSHAYQHLAQNWNSHKRVTIAIIGTDVFFLTPLALLAFTFPDLSFVFALCAVIPLVWMAVRLGAGTNSATAFRQGNQNPPADAPLQP